MAKVKKIGDKYYQERTKESIFTGFGNKLLTEETEYGETLHQSDENSVETKILEKIWDEITEDEYMESVEPFDNGGSQFIKTYRGIPTTFREIGLSPNEVGICYFMSDYVCYLDCVLRKNGDPRGHALSIKELSEMCRVKCDTFRKTISTLKKLDIIRVENVGTHYGQKDKWIVLNPYIFFRGNRIKHWVLEVFAGSKWETFDSPYGFSKVKESLEECKTEKAS